MKQSIPIEKISKQENQEDKGNKGNEGNKELIPFHYEAEIVKSNPDLRGHNWKQQGAYLKCDSCQLPHAVYIGTDKIMVGYNNDGSPRLVKRG